MVLELVAAFLEDPAGRCDELAKRLGEDHPDWESAAELVLPHIRANRFVTSSRVREAALGTVVRGCSEHVVAEVVNGWAEQASTAKKKDVRRKALEWLCAALRTRAAMTIAIAGTARVLESDDRPMREMAAEALDGELHRAANASEVMCMLASSVDGVEAKGKDGVIVRRIVSAMARSALHGHSIEGARRELEAIAARAAPVGDVAARALLYDAFHHGSDEAIDERARIDEITMQDLASCLDHAPAAAKTRMAARMLPLYVKALREGEPAARLRAAERIGALFLAGADPETARALLESALRDTIRIPQRHNKIADAAAVALAAAGFSPRDRAWALEILAVAMAERDSGLRERAAAASLRIHVQHGDLDAARALLLSPSAPVRGGAVRGVHWSVEGAGAVKPARSAVAPLRRDLETLEDEAGPAGDGARALLSTWGNADDLVRTATTRWRKALDLSVYDDPKVIDNVCKVLVAALHADSGHAGARALVAELCEMLGNVPDARPYLDRLERNCTPRSR